MKVQAINPFPHNPHDSVGISSHVGRFRISTRMLIAVLAIGMPLLQIAPAVAGEVLEIPQAVATPGAVTPHRHHHHVSSTRYAAPATSAASGPDTYATPGDAYATSGTVNPASSAAPVSDADAYANAGNAEPAPPPAAVAENSYPPDPNVGSINDYQNQPGENGQPPSFAMGGGGRRAEPQGSMTTNLILGGLFVGMVAYEIAASHHHR